MKVFLFPFENSILTKKVSLPYHVFEARYRQMIDDAIRTETPIAVVQPRAGGKYDDVICVAGIPKVLASYPDGRKDIYITGTTKHKLISEACDHSGRRINVPYDVYFADFIDEDMEIKDSFATELVTLKNLLEQWAFNFLPDDHQKNQFRNQLHDPELMVNYCITFLLDDARIKRKVVESNSLESKVQLLIDELSPKEISLGQFLPPLRFK